MRRASLNHREIFDVVFDPLWTKDRMSEAAKLQLGLKPTPPPRECHLRGWLGAEVGLPPAPSAPPITYPTTIVMVMPA